MARSFRKRFSQDLNDRNFDADELRGRRERFRRTMSFPFFPKPVLPGPFEMETAMRILFLAYAVLLMIGTPALADRPLTEEEKAKLTSALTAQGCSGGKMEFDNGLYEVDDARCGDGKIYDLKFGADFQLVNKKLED
jgi:hypothetical protein